jgi:hypothetical protein
MSVKIEIIAPYLLALGLAGYGCASDAHADPSGAALRGSAGAGATTVELDDDADEHVDEADDLDDDADEHVDERDGDDDVDERSEEAAGDDDHVTFDELPAAVKATVTSEVGSGTIIDIERDVERNGVVYEVDYTRDGTRREADVAEDGTLLRSKLDD